MLSIFKKLFGKSAPKVVARAATVRAPQLSEASAPMPSVEVAHLSLAVIVGRFSDELRATVLRAPDAASTIALPLPLIYKQLASGAVKMSLASLHRQAPLGVFGPISAGDKRQVEIPLQEVFRHVNLQALKRRVDQRPLDTPDNDFNLFGNSAKPYAIAPTTPENPPPKDSTALKFNPSPSSRVVRMDSGAPPVPETKRSGIAPPTVLRLVELPTVTNGSKAAATGPHSDAPPLTLPLAALANAWPEQICGEISALDPATTVTLNGGAVADGLANGKVVFTWGEIRAGLEPLPEEPTAIDEDTPLLLPLKIVAPAFLGASKKGKTERKNVQIDESIPSLFSDGREPAPAAIVLSPEEDPPADSVPAPELEAPSVVPVSVPHKVAETVGDVLGLPNQLEFTPAQIVAGTVKLPGVAGAIVALQEGLQVATSLPEGIKSDVVAAFLPQIFARLNQYAGEMKLGEVDDLLFTTHGAHCQIYRLGFVYFAILGQPGEALPWHELRLIAAELGRQTNQ